MSDRIARIEHLHPSLNSHLTLYRLERFGATVKLSSRYFAQQLNVQLWTNIVNKYNSEGRWHAIALPIEFQESEHTYHFKTSILPTSEGQFEFTYRIGLSDRPERWQWAGHYRENGYLYVEPPSPNMLWTQGANFVEIFPNVYVGNYIAASQAPELGIDAVLNLGEELNLKFPPDSPIAYKKIGLLDGAQHSIPERSLLEAIRWIDEQRDRGKQKILLHCRAGIGRSGSVGVAYCYSQFPEWTYRQTLDYVWSKKPDIYPHSHLQETVERLFPRSWEQ
jgi:hypothetical protein